MKQFIRFIAVLLITAGLVQSVLAQFNVSGPGFLPDENGTNLDDPQAKKGTSKVAAVTIVKDCADCPEMVVIPAGSFVMGSDKSSDEQPPHLVNLRSFLMGKTEVTQEQWEAVMGNNPSRNIGPMLPVENLSWDNVQQFVAKLNKRTGQKYRLPIEAEWEYAARAGTTTDWSFGNDESKLGNYAWYHRNSGQWTQPVGQKLPNGFGLYDMYGNVSEWTQDCFHFKYLGAPNDGRAWNDSCDGDFKIFRGGSSSENRMQYLRSASRDSPNPLIRTYNVGFRLARDL